MASKLVTFLSLPPEIRLSIYALALHISTKKTLRSKHELTSRRNRNGNLVPTQFTFTNISILLTCRIFYEEALPVFYSHNTFHFSIRTNGHMRTSDRFPQYLSHMRHLSLCFTREYPRTERTERADAKIAVVFQHIKHNCPNLRTLHLHILATQDTYLPFKDLIGSSQTARMLRSLLQRFSRLSLTTFGPPGALKRLRDGIADENAWDDGGDCGFQLLWPGMTISTWEYDGMPNRVNFALERGNIRITWARE